MNDKNEEWIFSKDTLRAILSTIIANKKEIDEMDKSTFNDGMKLAYDEVIDAIRYELQFRGIDLDDFLKESH